MISGQPLLQALHPAALVFSPGAVVIRFLECTEHIGVGHGPCRRPLQPDRPPAEQRRDGSVGVHQVGFGSEVGTGTAPGGGGAVASVAARISSICLTHPLSDWAAIWKLVWSETHVTSRAN